MWLVLSILFGAGTFLFGQDLPLAPKPPSMSDFPPTYEVQIAPTSVKMGTSDSRGPNYWRAGGYDLRGIIERVYQVDRSRIDLLPSLEDGRRYDFTLRLQTPENQADIDRRVQRAILEKFDLVANFETRRMDVYTLTAPNGETASLRAARSNSSLEDGFPFSGSSSSLEFAIASSTSSVYTSDESPTTPPELLQALNRGRGAASYVRGVSISSSTMEQLCRTLETGLDRPVVDETHLTGVYDLEVRPSSSSTEDFFASLHEKLGLMITPEHRDVTFLVVRPKLITH
jgi:uncharacterized protein (TIGR03435 family)